MRRSRHNSFGPMLGIALAVLLAPVAARAATLQESMDTVAAQLGKQLRKAGAQRVLVTLDGPANDGASKLMRQTFVDALQSKAGVEVTKLKPDFKLAMEYSRSDRSNEYAMSIRLKDSGNVSVGTFNTNFQFDDVVDRATVEGSTFDASVSSNGGSQAATKSAIEGGLAAPPDVALAPDNATAGALANAAGAAPAVGPTSGNVVSPGPRSRFRIEILVAPGRNGDYVPRLVEKVDGFAFTDLAIGEVYAVKIYNDAPHAVAVDLAIDGGNMWTTSGIPAWKANGKFLVDPGSSTVIKGFHFGTAANPSLYREFTVVDVPDSLAAELGSDQSAIGQVSAQFFAAWGPNEEPPIVEPLGSQGGTKPGAEVTHETNERTVFIGQSLLAAVTIRYVRPEAPSDLPPPN
jgi:hypothetical protein